jgi:hypothetical protein
LSVEYEPNTGCIRAPRLCFHGSKPDKQHRGEGKSPSKYTHRFKFKFEFIKRENQSLNLIVEYEPYTAAIRTRSSFLFHTRQQGEATRQQTG